MSENRKEQNAIKLRERGEKRIHPALEGMVLSTLRDFFVLLKFQFI